MSASPKKWRRWFRFRLRTLIFVWLVLSAWLGWWIVNAKQQRDAVANIKNLTSEVFVDYSFQRLGNDPLRWRPESDQNAVSWVPAFALKSLGIDYFTNISL